LPELRLAEDLDELRVQSEDSLEPGVDRAYVTMPPSTIST